MSHARLLDELRGIAGDELCELLRASGRRLRGYRNITTLTSAVEPRVTLLLELDDGSRLKGRRLRSEERARDLERLFPRVGPGFSRILARRGCAVLEEWIEGTPMPASPRPAPSLLWRCGFILGSLHEVELPPGDVERALAPADLLARLGEQTRELVHARCLTEEEGARALAIARGCAPERAPSGIVHLDYCAENIVLAEASGPICIDNVRLDVGAPAFDVARTWYRWSLSVSERAHFAAGYRDATRRAPFDRAFAFWALAALIGATAWRRRVMPRAIQAPLARLRGLLAWLAAHGDARPDRIFAEACAETDA